MMKTTRRTFLKTATIASIGYMVAEGNAQEQGNSANEKPGIAAIGVGGRGGRDSSNAARFGNAIAICDVDKMTLDKKGNSENFQKAKRYTDYREMLEKHEKEIDIVIVSTPDHMHAAQTLMAMRMGKHVYAQNPLTRTIYEARLLGKIAEETGVCTQMGNQGNALNESRMAIAQIKNGVIGKIKAVYAWSSEPAWAWGPDRRQTMADYAQTAYDRLKDDQAGLRTATADKMIWAKSKEIQRNLENLDWKNWIGVAKFRDFFPGLYHSFHWRGWWDFGTGALGDTARHLLSVPFASCGLKDPTWIRARTTGHDSDSFPVSSVIEYEFPANGQRGAILFRWYDRTGNRPPKNVFAPYKIDQVSDSGVLIVGDKGAFYSPSDCGEKYELIAEGGEPIKSLEGLEVDFAENKGRADASHMHELFRAVKANDPKMCRSNFIDHGGPLIETILLGNLAVWTASQGGTNGAMGDWGEKIEWNAKNLVVSNLSALKTPGVADLITPVYSEGYRLD